MKEPNVDVVERELNSAYVIVATEISFNRELSSVAKAIWFTVMTLPPNWNFSIKGISTVVPESEYAIGKALKDLEAHGYLERTRLRDESGRRLAGTRYRFRQNSLNRGSRTQENNTDSIGVSLNRGSLNQESSVQYKDLKNKEEEREEYAPDPESIQEVAETVSVKEFSDKLPKPKRPTQASIRAEYTTVPDDFQITASMREWAAKRVPTLDIDYELDNFVDLCQGKGYRNLNWEATWRLFMKGAVESGRGKLLTKTAQYRSGNGKFVSSNGIRMLDDVLEERDRRLGVSQ